MLQTLAAMPWQWHKSSMIHLGLVASCMPACRWPPRRAERDRCPTVQAMAKTCAGYHQHHGGATYSTLVLAQLAIGTELQKSQQVYYDVSRFLGPGRPAAPGAVRAFGSLYLSSRARLKSLNFRERNCTPGAGWGVN